MSSNRTTPSKPTGSKPVQCTRSFSNGTTCNRPIGPVFGVWPAECTQCASRIFSTKEGFEAVTEILDVHYGILRRLTLAASIPGNVWAIKNAKQRFTLLDKLTDDIGGKRLMRRMSMARMLSNRDSSGKLVNEPRRVSLGSMWRTVAQDRAMELKRGGFEVRYIGVAWQVKVS